MFQPLARRSLRHGLTLSAVAFLTTALTPMTASAQDSTWNGPGNDFNNNNNWTPAVVPTNRATFLNAPPTAVNVTLATTLNQIRFGAGASAYTLTNQATLIVNGISGVGIDNQSSTLQTVINGGTMTLNNASVTNGANTNTFLNNDGTLNPATLTLNGTSQLGAGTQLFGLGGNATATAANVIGGVSSTIFNDTSGADSRTLLLTGGVGFATGQGGIDALAVGGVATMTFNDNAHADNAAFVVNGGTAVAISNGNSATGVGGVAAINFNDSSHADGALFSSTDGGATSISSFDGRTTVALGGVAQILLADTSHADNANFAIGAASVTAIGGGGRAGTPSGNAAVGGDAIGFGGSNTLALQANSHANGAAITLTAGATVGIGGGGGAGDTGVGGTGGASQAVGGLIGLNIRNNAQVNNATVTSVVQDALAVGGSGGVGGTTGAGGVGGQSSAGGGNVNIAIRNDASVNGTVFNNTGGAGNATGGLGGNGSGGAGTGGAGGDAQGVGGAVLMTITDNVTLGAGTVINNTAGSATAVGGKGGNGGAVGDGGDGGNATATGGNATVQFTGNASAGNATIVNTGGSATVTGGAGGNGTTGSGGSGGFASASQGLALVSFNGSATAGAATIQNQLGPNSTLGSGASGTGPAAGGGGGGSISFTAPEIRFTGNATGGSAHITNAGGAVNFNDNSVFGTAANGGARIDNSALGTVSFFDATSLGNGQIVNGGGANFASIFFQGTATAGTGSITNNNLGSVLFDGSSSLGSATINNNAGGTLDFSGSSDGVAGTVINAAGANMRVFTNAFRLGSLSGDGTVEINSTALQVGYLDRNETFAGVISSTGQLVKRGTGTFTLTGTNSYTGNTAVAAGTLQIGNGGTTGSVLGNIDVLAGANLAFNRSNTITFGGVVSGAGTLTKLGTGTLILTNDNTYTGGTFINAGTLQLGNGGTNGTIVGNIVNNAALVGNQSNSQLISGNISGMGTLTQIGAGNLILTGANTYTGLTTISAGTLTVGNGATQGSIVSNVLNNGVLRLNRSDTYIYAGNISGTGSLVIPSIGTIILTGTNTYTGGTFHNAGGILQIGNGGTTGSIIGNVAISSVNGTLAFNRSDTVTFGGVVSGAGRLTQAGTGTLVLTGANTYSGGTFVNAGTLELNGSVASLATIAAGARLTGVGTVNGGITNGGTISPGNATSPFGTLTATGAVTFNAGSFLAPTVNSAGQSSLLQAGSLTINGGQVRPTLVSGGLFLMQSDFRIANGTGGRTGTFTGVDAALVPSFLTASLNYVGNDVFLRLRRNATTFAQTTGLTPNQSAVSTSLDAAVAANNPLVFTTYLTTYNSLLPLSGAQLQGALNVLSVDALTAFPVAAQEHANRFAERLASYTWSNSSNLWGLIAYGDQNVDGDGNGPGFDANGVEFQMGFNTSLGHDTRLGLSVGKNNGDVSVDDRLTTGNVDTWSVGAQLRHDFGQLYVSGQLTYSWHSIDSSRPLFVAGTAEADYGAKTWTAAGELGWVLRSGQLSIEPHLSVRHANTNTDAYSETGPVGALDVDPANYQTTRLGIGIRLANREPAAPVKFHILARYERETGDDRSVLDNTLPGLPSFSVVGTRLGDDILSGEIGAEFRISSGFSFFAAGSGHTRSNETSVQANAGLRVVF